MNRLALNNSWSRRLNQARFIRGKITLAINRFTKRVHNPSDQGITHRN